MLRSGAGAPLNGARDLAVAADPGGSGSWIGVAGADRQLAGLFADAELARTLTPADFLEPSRSDARFAGLPRRDVSDCVELLDWPWNLVKKNQELLLSDLRP